MPVRSAADALFLLGLAAQEPLAPATYTFFLDRDGAGGVITEVSGGAAPDSVLHIVGIMASAAQNVDHAELLVVATVRPDGSVLPGDADRWSAASEICSAHGITLVEWFVISPHGAGLNNLVFARTGAAVVEVGFIDPDFHLPSDYMCLARNLGLSYWLVLPTQTGYGSYGRSWV
jgi:hypothetical protein